ncbi:MAG: sugar phosphate isomerase/epimerase [Lentisphaerae bacterium]|nr:sugar phosphate isomerase/epimerase [Lentisphaerota bacterium]MBE6390509.1 sugar phosphate isomerase/epimerase [Lentisphaerota bacterium]
MEIMKRSQLAAQLFTLREFLKTPADVAKTLPKVREIGYETIQVSGMGPIDEAELAKIAADCGLTICATHEAGARICDETDAVIERLKKLNCRYTAYPYPHLPIDSKAAVIDLAGKINDAAVAMAKEGITLSYHNHALEFGRVDGELVLDLIYKNAPDLAAEIDTFWIQTGGQNPVDWIRRFPGKQPLLHLKEYGIIGRERKMFAVGSGNLNWKEIIAAGTECAVEYFIVEQDDCNGLDPFDELRSSFNYIAENFFD